MVQTKVKTDRAARRPVKNNGLARALQPLLRELAELPPYEEAPELYRDWGEQQEFTVEVGRGECAQ